MPLIELPEIGQKYYLVAFDAAGRERTRAAKPAPRSSRRFTPAMRPTSSCSATVGRATSRPQRSSTRPGSARWRLAPGTSNGCRIWPGGRLPLCWSASTGRACPGGAKNWRRLIRAEGRTLRRFWRCSTANRDPGRRGGRRDQRNGGGEGSLRTILLAAADDVAPKRLPDSVRQAIAVLCHEAELDGSHVGADPGRDHEPFDPDQAYAIVRLRPDGEEYGRGALGGVLDLLRQLSFWKMKARALRIGKEGAGCLLRDLQAAVDAKNGPRFHLMGHSFGCIVASAMLSGAPAQPRPVDSLSLVQGAMSLWSYCDEIRYPPYQPGYFHGVIADRLVNGPIVTTSSIHDLALGTWYGPGVVLVDQYDYETKDQVAFPWYAAVGTYGLRGSGLTVVDETMKPADQDYAFTADRYNLEASNYINRMEGISRAHSSIDVPEVAHAVWDAARVGGMLKQRRREGKMNYADLEIGLHKWNKWRYTLELRDFDSIRESDLRVSDETLTPKDLDPNGLRNIFRVDNGDYGRHLTALLFKNAHIRGLLETARGEAKNVLKVPLRLRLAVGRSAFEAPRRALGDTPRSRRP